MKYTADTGFFIKLAQLDQRALKIWQEIIEGKARLIIPAPVIVETTKYALQKGKNNELQKLFDSIGASQKVAVMDLSFDLARKAGALAFAYNLSATDGSVLATAEATGFDKLLTSDTGFRRARKDGKVQIVEFI